MDDIEKVLAIVVLVATAFKTFTSGFKDIYDMLHGTKKKRRPPSKGKRRK